MKIVKASELTVKKDPSWPYDADLAVACFESFFLEAKVIIPKVQDAAATRQRIQVDFFLLI